MLPCRQRDDLGSSNAPSMLNIHMAFATIGCEPLTSARVVQRTIPVLRLRKGGTEQIASRHREVLQCLSEECRAYGDKRMRGRFSTCSICTHTLHSLFLHYIIRCIICSLNSAESSAGHIKALIFCQWYSINFNSVTGCWKPALHHQWDGPSFCCPSKQSFYKVY